MKHQATRLIAIAISALVVFTALVPSASCLEQRESATPQPGGKEILDTSGEDKYVYEEVVYNHDGDATVNGDPNGKETGISRTEAKYTRNHYSDSGNLEWSVTLTATFYFDHKTSDCASASISHTIYNNNWSLVTESSPRDRITAIGNATMKISLLGVPMFKYVTLKMTCDKDGHITRN